MKVLFFGELIIFLLVIIYVIGLLSILFLENKIFLLFKNYNFKVEKIKYSKISPAVMYAKIFKLSNDYRIQYENVNRIKKIILKSMLLNRKFIENKNCLSLHVR